MYSLHLTLISSSRCSIGFSGKNINAWLLSALSDYNKSLAEKIHSGKYWPMSPYSVKPLFYRNKIAKKIIPKREYTVKISILDDSLKEPFILSLAEKLGEKVKLGKCEFILSNIHGSLWNPKRVRAYSLSVRFRSPTFFKVIGRDKNILFPISRGLLGTPMRLWNYFIENRFTKDDLDRLSNLLFLLEYDVRTVKPIRLSRNRKVIGFIGEAKFEVLGEAETISELLSLGEFSNVGGSRTLGFGCIEVNFNVAEEN